MAIRVVIEAHRLGLPPLEIASSMNTALAIGRFQSTGPEGRVLKESPGLNVFAARELPTVSEQTPNGSPVRG
jgi:hypothetical protein